MLLHPNELSPSSQVRTGTKNLVSRSMNTDFDAEEATNQLERAQVSSTIGVGEKVCLSVVPVKVKAKGGAGPVIKTYALLDSRSEVTRCHGLLRKKLGVSGAELDFTLSGMTGSMRMNSQLIDITVTSIDNEASVDLSNVRTVTEISISGSCIGKREDVRSCPHSKSVECINRIDQQSVNLASKRSNDPIMGQEMRSLQSSCSWETEIECQRKNDDLNQQLESLWKTDFDGSLLDSKSCDSMEDRKALKIMGLTLTT